MVSLHSETQHLRRNEILVLIDSSSCMLKICVLQRASPTNVVAVEYGQGTGLSSISFFLHLQTPRNGIQRDVDFSLLLLFIDGTEQKSQSSARRPVWPSLGKLCRHVKGCDQREVEPHQFQSVLCTAVQKSYIPNECIGAIVIAYRC